MPPTIGACFAVLEPAWSEGDDTHSTLSAGGVCGSITEEDGRADGSNSSPRAPALYPSQPVLCLGSPFGTLAPHHFLNCTMKVGRIRLTDQAPIPCCIFTFYFTANVNGVVGCIAWVNNREVVYTAYFINGRWFTLPIAYLFC